jgi:Rieske Fe-S protein
MTIRRSDACDSCARRSRRTFMTRVSGAVAAVAVCDEWARTLGALAVVHAAGTSAGPSAKSYPLPAKDGVTIDDKEQVILVRWQQKVFAFPLSCPHENTALKWRQGDQRFQCPKHESKYKPDGTFISGRATRNMDRFVVTRDGTAVVVNLEKWFESDKQPGEWAAASLAI